MSEKTKTPVEPAVSATVIVVRGEGPELEVAMMRRSGKLGYHGGSWVFPGGRVDAEDHDGAADALSAARRAAVREANEEAGLLLDPAALVHHAHWTTPLMRPRRFATDYFLVRHDAELKHDGSEIVEARWARPQDVLNARDSGDLVLPPPTFVTLWRLAHEGEALFEGPVLRILPRPIAVGDGFISLYDGDAGYDDEDLEREGRRHRVHLFDTWSYERT